VLRGVHFFRLYLLLALDDFVIQDFLGQNDDVDEIVDCDETAGCFLHLGVELLENLSLHLAVRALIKIFEIIKKSLRTYPPIEILQQIVSVDQNTERRAELLEVILQEGYLLLFLHQEVVFYFSV
jgi:hypothetical protein